MTDKDADHGSKEWWIRQVIGEDWLAAHDADVKAEAVAELQAKIADLTQRLELSNQWVRMYNRSVEQGREFLQQVADAFGIQTDEVTTAFLERAAAAIRGGEKND